MGTLLIISSAANLIMLVLLVLKQTKRKSDPSLITRLLTENDYLRARIRGFQQYATRDTCSGELK